MDWMEDDALADVAMDRWTENDTDTVRSFISKKRMESENLEAVGGVIYRKWGNKVLSAIARWTGDCIHVHRNTRCDFITNHAVTMVKNLGPKGSVYGAVDQGFGNTTETPAPAPVVVPPPVIVPNSTPKYVRAKDFVVRHPTFSHRPEHKIIKVYKRRKV